jgi:hypothetical protein
MNAWTGRPYAPLALTTAASLVAAGAIAMASASGWPATANEIGLVSKYCERNLAGPVRQPANAWSNLCFVAVGLAILWRLGRDPSTAARGDNEMVGPTTAGVLFGVTAVALGFGSFLYHATLTGWSEALDPVTMLAWITVPLLRTLGRIGGWRDRTFFGAYLVANLVAIALMVYDHLLGIPVFTALVALTLAVDLYTLSGRPPRIRPRRPWPWLALGSVAMLLAAHRVWALSRPGGPLCEPDMHWMQGHAVWHAMSAMAIGSYFLYCRTEGRPAEAPVLSPSAATEPGGGAARSRG